ncbi:MAG: hypothetical protein GDA50_04290 [Alphaproteobacteria bacterium GM202ARS2]|nr:hypothetical protein [Alphaproteobacteria bacterium GM202ARS2]
MQNDSQLMIMLQALDSRVTGLEIFLKGQNGQQGLIDQVELLETGMKDLQAKQATAPKRRWQLDDVWKWAQRLFKAWLALMAVGMVLGGKIAWKELLGVAKLVLS